MEDIRNVIMVQMFQSYKTLNVTNNQVLPNGNVLNLNFLFCLAEFNSYVPPTHYTLLIEEHL